jgi:hypothetical protein
MGSSQPPAAPPVEVLRLDTDVYNLAYDAAINSLWFAQMRGVEPDYLYRVDAATGESERWQLPETLHNGFLSEVEIAEDGGVWISYEYKLLRFDPATETIGMLQFPIRQPEANQAGGTWIAGLGTDGDGVWVALNGLSEVALVDSTLREVRRIALQDAWRYAFDVASAEGTLFLVRKAIGDGPAGVGVMSSTGEEVAFVPLQAQRLAAVEGRVLAYPDDYQRGETAWVAADGGLDRIDTGSVDDAATPISAEAVVIYSNPFGEDPARIVQYHGERETVIAAFEKRWVPFDDCHGLSTFASPSAMSSCPPILVGAPEIGAMTASPNGTLWYFENFSGQASILWMLEGPR